jgi:hypothetical protein
MFGGKYDPTKLSFPINWLAGKEPASDLSDLTAVRAWASNLAAQLEPALPLSSGIA